MWAIGTGKACGLEDILSSYNLIKKIAKENKFITEAVLMTMQCKRNH